MAAFVDRATGAATPAPSARCRGDAATLAAYPLSLIFGLRITTVGADSLAVGRRIRIVGVSSAGLWAGRLLDVERSPNMIGPRLALARSSATPCSNIRARRGATTLKSTGSSTKRVTWRSALTRFSGSSTNRGRNGTGIPVCSSCSMPVTCQILHRSRPERHAGHARLAPLAVRRPRDEKRAADQPCSV